MIVEPVVHLYTHVVTLRVVFGEFCQHINLEFSCVSVLLDILDDLNGENLVLLKIFTSDYFAKSSFSELSCYLVSARLNLTMTLKLVICIPALNDIPGFEDEMTLLVILHYRSRHSSCWAPSR